LPLLRELSLAGTGVTGATLPDLLGRLDRLEYLSLWDNRSFEARRFPELLAALNPATFRRLHCYHTPVGTVGMRALAAARRFTGLTELWLRGGSFDAESMEALAEATHLTGVTTLYLADDPLAAEGGVALAAWPGLRSVRRLDVDRCGIGPRGAEALARSPHLGPLEELGLRANYVGDAGAVALAATEKLSGLHTLRLPENEITAAGARALATSSRLGRLRHLDLRQNPVGDEGAGHLAESPALRGLRWLTLGESGMSQAASRRLIACLPRLTVFSGSRGFLGAEELEAIRAGLAAGGSEDDVTAAVGDRLVQAILDDPDDWEARNLYAQFLQEIDSPWWVVVNLQRPDHYWPEEAVQRWQGWFEAGRNDWLAPLLPWARLFDDRESFDRGFLRKVAFTGPLPDDVARSLARFPPLALLPLEVQRGQMTGAGAFQVLAHRRCLARMTRLDFRSITPAELAHVLGSPHLTALEELSFGFCRLGDEAARLLAAAPAAARLRVLGFGRATPEGGWVADAANRVGPDGLAALGAAPPLAGLRSLGLFGNRTAGDAGMRALLAAPHLRGLVSLDLRSAGLTVAGVRALAGSPWAGSLRTLLLGGLDPLGDDALAALAASPYLAGLRELDVCGCRGGTDPHPLPATDDGAHSLAASTALAGLRVLRASCWEGLGDAGVAALRGRFGPGFVRPDGRPA
jgi:hypothetical protein